MGCLKHAPAGFGIGAATTILGSMDEQGATPGTSTRAHGVAVISRLAGTNRRLHISGYGVAVLGTAAVTFAFLPSRDTVTPLSKGFAFLVVVVVADAIGGLGPGVLASVSGFVAFNFFFIPPYGRLTIGRGEYVVVLFVFLGLSLLISELLARATERAHTAEAREAELRTIQELSRELVTACTGPGDLRARAVDRDGLVRLRGGGALRRADRGGSRARRAGHGRRAHRDRSNARGIRARTERAPERLPLSVGGRNLGLVVLTGERAPLSPCREPGPSGVLRSARTGARARPAPAGRDRGGGVPPDRPGSGDRSGRGLARPAQPACGDQGVGHRPARRGTGDRRRRRRRRSQASTRKTDRLNALIANLLDMSRIESRRPAGAVQTVDLAEIVADAVDRARRQWPGLDVSVRVAARSGLVRGRSGLPGPGPHQPARQRREGGERRGGRDSDRGGARRPRARWWFA